MHVKAVIRTPDSKTGVIGPKSTLIALQGKHGDSPKQRDRLARPAMPD